MKQRIKNFICGIPVIGPLFESTWSELRESSHEFIVNFGVSTLPIWFGAAVIHFTKQSTSCSAALRITVENGELFIFGTAALGPAAYLIGKDRRGYSPRQLWIIVVLMLLTFAACTGFFALYRAGVTLTDVGNLLYVSLASYCLTLVIQFVTIVSDKTTERRIAAALSEESKDFSDQFNKRHK